MDAVDVVSCGCWGCGGSVNFGDVVDHLMLEM